MHRPHCVYPFTVDGHLDCFHLLAFMNNAAMDIDVHVFVWTYVSFLLGVWLEVTWLGPVVPLCLTI